MPSPHSILQFATPALALFLSACATTTERDRLQGGFDAPDQWRNGPESASERLDTVALASWWTRFDDPLLAELVEDSLARSPSLAIALSRIEEARARRGMQRAGLLPSLRGGISASGSQTRDHAANATRSSESYGAGVDASWEVDLFGTQRLALEAADASLEQATEAFYAAQVSLAAEVATTYVSLRAAEARLRVVESNLQIREETTQLTLWREEAGVGSALSTQQSLAALQQTRASLPALRQSIVQLRNALTLLSGRPPGELDELLAAPGSIPSAPAQIAIGIPAEVLRQRPDLRAAEQAVEAAAALAQAADRARLPSLSLSGSIGIDALRAGDLLSPATSFGRVVGSLAAPLFDAGRIRSSIQIQNEQAEQALLAYETSLLAALVEVENALVALRHSSERLDLIERGAAAAEEAAALAASQYEAGQVDVFALLDAQGALLSLQDQRASATAEQTAAHIQLYKALGGGWSPLDSLAATAN